MLHSVRLFLSFRQNVFDESIYETLRRKIDMEQNSRMFEADSHLIPRMLFF